MRQTLAPMFVGLLALLASCDRAPSPAPPAPAGAQRPPAESVVRFIQIETLAQTRANRVTHVCVDPQSSNLYWTQESDDGQDVMFALPNAAAPATGAGSIASEVSRATELTTANILAAMEKSGNRSGASKSSASDVRKSGSGSIQSIAAGPDGEIYFFFSGGVGKTTRVMLGRFDPTAGPRDAIRILADTGTIAAATGMGGSLGLARGQLIVQREGRGSVATSKTSRILLLVRHSDAWSLFQFEPRLLPVNGQIALSRAKVPGISTDLRRADTNERIDLSREDLELSAGLGDGSLILCDRSIGVMYRVAPGGRVEPIASMIGFPGSFTAPVSGADDVLDADAVATAQAAQRSRTSLIVPTPPDGYATCFMPDGAPIDPRHGVRADAPDVHASWPAMMSVPIPAASTMSSTASASTKGAGADDEAHPIPVGAWAVLDRDDFRAPAEIAVQTLRLRQLIPIDARSFGSANVNAPIRTTAAFVGYDGTSGMLLRLRVVEKR